MAWEIDWILTHLIIPIVTVISVIFAIYYKMETRKRDLSEIIPIFKLTYIRTDLEGLREKIGTTFSKEQYMELRKYRIEKGNGLQFIQNKLIIHSHRNRPPSNIKWECLYLTNDNKSRYDSHMKVESSNYLDDPYFFWPGLVLHNKDILSDKVKEILFSIYYTDPENCYMFKACHVFKRVKHPEWEPIASDFHKNKYIRCKPEIKKWIKEWKKLGGKRPLLKKNRM